MDNVTNLLTLGSVLSGVGGGLILRGDVINVILGLVAFVLAGFCFYVREKEKVA